MDDVQEVTHERVRGGRFSKSNVKKRTEGNLHYEAAPVKKSKPSRKVEEEYPIPQDEDVFAEDKQNKRANTILNQLETDNRQQGISSKPTAEIASNRDGMQLSFFQLEDPVLCQVRDEILNLDVNNLTPLEALNKLNDIKKIVRGK